MFFLSLNRDKGEYLEEGMMSVFQHFIFLFSLGKGPFPGILDLYTFGGALCEPRASLLANKGFVVLALAYYGYQDLPKNPQNFDLEYFEEAAIFLRRQPQVSTGDKALVLLFFHPLTSPYYFF